MLVRDALEADREVRKFRHRRRSEADAGQVLFARHDAAGVLRHRLVDVSGLQLQGVVLDLPNGLLVDEIFLSGQKNIRDFKTKTLKSWRHERSPNEESPKLKNRA